MTSSLGDQLGALLGDVTASVNDDQPEIEAPPGAHGEVIGVLRRMESSIPSVELSTPLAEYGLDRLGVVELAVRCEEEVGVLVEDDAIADFKTLGDVVNYLQAKRDEK